jgi:MoaA/NifB/PqqE/SkfB family radical SAM enzyme
MCYAWVKQKENKEFSLDEIKCIFNDKLIRNNLEVINITGGEPTLRPDLTEIIRIITKNCIRLSRIDISTNGVNTSQIVDQIERILALLLPINIKLTASISLDGIGEIHEQVRGAPDIFSNIESSIRELKELMLIYPFFSLGINMTVSKLNYFAIEEMQEFALKKGVGINFTLAASSEIGVESKHVRKEFEMNQEEKDKVVLSLERLLESKMIDPQYAKFLFIWLKTGKRYGGCAFRRGKAVLVEPGGEVYLCGNFRESRIANILEGPLVEMWGKAGNKLKGLSERCLTCVSNCYMDEVR